MKHLRTLAAIALIGLMLLLSACNGQRMGAGAPAATAAPASTPTPAPTPEPVVFASGASYPASAERIETPLAPGETELLERFDRLQTAEVSGSADYAELAAYAAAHPEVAFRFTEDVGGVEIAHDAVSLDLTGVPIAEFERVLAMLPLLADLTDVNLNRLDGAPVPDGADAIRYANAAEGGADGEDDADGETEAEPQTDVVDEPAADGETEAELAPTFANRLDWGQLGRLQQARPDVRFDYVFSYLGRTFSAADEAVDLSSLRVGNERVDQVRALMEYLPHCRELTMERCKVDNERMAALRDALPQMKVVWRVSFGAASSRTDAKRIRLVKDDYRFTRSDLETLRYCTEVELLDVGHNWLTTIEFVRYMPKLRVAIFAIGSITDLSPLACCPELEYVELFNNDIVDLSPLAGLKNLRHIELTLNGIEDPSPLFGLKELERLWIGNNNIPEELQAELVEQLPGCYINFRTTPTADGWREDPRYEQLREEFDYRRPKNGSY